MKDWLNEPLTHVERTCSVFRSSANERLTALANLVPESYMGVPVEYDITYGSPSGKISGYKFTDLLTSCISISPCNSGIYDKLMKDSLEKEVTDVGLKVTEKVTQSLQDKYLLAKSTDHPKSIVVLPGSNVLDNATIDWDHITQAIEDGAVIKPHPITTKLSLIKLEKRYPGKILSKEIGLYGMLPTCDTIYFTAHSELGIASMLLGKNVHIISTERKNKNSATYESIYKALLENKRDHIEQLAALFSHPESGIVSTFHSEFIDVEQWVNAFFFQFNDIPHGRKNNFVCAKQCIVTNNVQVTSG